MKLNRRQAISFDWNHRSAAATSSMSLEKFQKKSSWNWKQDVENEIEAFRQTKAEKRKNWPLFKKNCSRKKQIAGNTEVLLTADNLQQYVKKIEVDHKKNTYTEFVF